MKPLLFASFLFFTIVSFGQIELEHTYLNGNGFGVVRVNLEYSGEKYYSLKSETNQLELYNPDHSLWKTVQLEAPAPTTVSGTRIFHVSQAKILPDANLEIVYSYHVNGFGYVTKVVSDDGTVLQTVPYGYSAYMSELPGLSDKLIVYGGDDNCRVYSVPELVLEHTYPLTSSVPFDIVYRVDLQNSGEKYYVIQNQNLVFYNPDHTLWKTIGLPKPPNAGYRDLDVIADQTSSEPMKIGYVYSVYSGANVYSARIIDENGNQLLTVANVNAMNVSSFPGANDKLIMNYSSGYSPEFQPLKYSNVYDLSSLTLEHTFENDVIRTPLENSGEKYYTFSNTLKQAKIYNSDYSLWKTIPLTIPVSSYILRSLYLSETKIIADPSIEVIYSYQYGCSGSLPCVSDSYVVDENGQVLLALPNAIEIRLSEFPGRANKLIATLNDVNVSPYSYGAVYGMGTLGNSVFEKESAITVSPNPASSFLNITSENTIVEAVIYNMNGVQIHSESAPDIYKINVENLAAGIYLLVLYDNNSIKTTHKIMVLR